MRLSVGNSDLRLEQCKEHALTATLQARKHDIARLKERERIQCLRKMNGTEDVHKSPGARCLRDVVLVEWILRRVHFQCLSERRKSGDHGLLLFDAW